MLDIDKLIESVRSRPALYDMHCKDYNNRKRKAECWDEVGQEVYTDWNEITPSQRNIRGKLLMKKWKAVRDNFVREYKVRAENGSAKKRKYMFYDQLKFLLPFLKHNDKALTPEGDERAFSTLSTLWHDLPSSEPPETERQERPKLISSASDSLILEMQEECNTDRYGNKAFLMSYLPIMDRLPQQTQLHARMLITQVFCDLQTQTVAEIANE